MPQKWTHYQVSLSFGNGQDHPYWLVYSCRKVTRPNGSWWLRANSYRWCSW